VPESLIFAGLYLPPKAGRDTLALSYLRTLSVHYFGLAAGDSVSFLDITGLEVNYSGLTSDDLKAALRNAPSLNYLRIKYCSHCFDDALIGAGPAPALFEHREHAAPRQYKRRHDEHDCFTMVAGC
jgi:hypothetical protein